MRAPPPRRRSEPTIALINVVFLMLIFFMVAGTLAPPLDPELSLVNTRELEGREPADALVLTASGTLRYRGAEVDGPGPYLDSLPDLSLARIVPDRNAPAPDLLRVTRALRQAGAERVLIVTEQALR